MAKSTKKVTKKKETNQKLTGIKSYDDAIKIINKSFGEGAISLGASTFIKCETFPTGIYALDWAFGCGGVPRGRIIEMFGTESSGKTTACLKMIASCQKSIINDNPGVAAFIDAEHALDPSWAIANGVDWDKLLFAQPNHGEEALQTVEMLASAGVPLIVVDSVAALTPKKELEGEIGDSHVGAQARMMSQACRKIKGICNKRKSTVVFINQLREKIGVMFGCLHADNQVNFVDGRSISIKEVVENRIQGEVWSYDEANNKIVPAKIIDWHYNGEVESPDDYISISLKGPNNRNGRMNITVTPLHEVRTEIGYEKAENLCIGDKLLTKQEMLLDGTFALAYAEVVNIRNASKRQMKNTGRYDLSIAGNKNYSVGGAHNGVIVHNSPETTPGGRALKFYASLRMKVSITGVEKQKADSGEVPIARNVKINVVKNKVAPPFKTAEFSIYFGEKKQTPIVMKGVDAHESLFRAAVLTKVMRANGSHYYFGDEALGNGKNTAIAALKNDTELFKKVEKSFMNAIQPINPVEAKDTEEEEESNFDAEG